MAFSDNRARFGGAMSSTKYSEISFGGNTIVTYEGNEAFENGATVYSLENSVVTGDGYSKMTFSKNKARVGGAVCSVSHSINYFICRKHNSDI